MKRFYNFMLSLAILLCTHHADAQTYTIYSHIMFANCDSQTFRMESNAYASTQQIETFFGDGSSATDTFFNSGGRGLCYRNHVFADNGVYTIKHVLLNSGVPVDSVSYSDTVDICHVLNFLSYVDNNADCIHDAGDIYMPNPYSIEIDSAGVVLDTVTTTSLYYVASALAPHGTIYTFKVITMPAGYVVSCPSTGIIYDTIGATGSFKTIGFTCDTSTFDLSVYGWFSPAASGACAHVYVNNYGCTPQTATVKLNYSPKYLFDHTYPSGISSTTGTDEVTFNVGTVGAGSPAGFIAYFTPVGSPTLGDTTTTTWSVTPVTGDTHPANNTLTRIDSVRSSYDPNEKAVTPQGIIAAGTQLQYNIGFENTGTDTAYNIHIQDTLSDDVDVKTFKLISATAHVTTEITTWGGHNIVKFDFANINLLDVHHSGQCTGMVVFTIKSKAGLPNGTVISNKAGIYFDANAVVMTNKVNNIIGIPTGVATMSNVATVSIYPNPTTNLLTINTGGKAYDVVDITNTMGQLILSKHLSAAISYVNVQALPAGIYYIMFKGDAGVEMKKFEKL